MAKKIRSEPPPRRRLLAPTGPEGVRAPGTSLDPSTAAEADPPTPALGGEVAPAPLPSGRVRPFGAPVPTQPGEELEASLRHAVHDDDNLVPRSLEHLMEDVQILSAEVEPLPPEDDVDGPPDRARAIAIGLLIGAALGLVIDAILSNWLFSGL
ncbi:MAG: hypothetical protein H6733_12345 [Alphaproteobacteria bacterium]|nr:hypothetical protein [Alphaproteobacteria bacterium]